MPDEAADALRDALLTGARDDDAAFWSTGSTDRACPGVGSTGRLPRMWTHVSPDGAPDEDWLRRVDKPENEVPVALPLNVLVARTDSVAIALLGLQVFSTGVSFDLVVRLRPAAEQELGTRLNELFWERGPGAPGFLFGLEFADGRRVSNVSREGRDGDVVFHAGGGGGGSTSIDQRWWLSPLPPPGRLLVVVRCDELGVAETVTEVDATVIDDAVGGVVELWPWEPPRERTPPEPVPPDVPQDSWFAGR